MRAGRRCLLLYITRRLRCHDCSWSWRRGGDKKKDDDVSLSAVFRGSISAALRLHRFVARHSVTTGASCPLYRERYYVSSCFSMSPRGFSNRLMLTITTSRLFNSSTRGVVEEEVFSTAGNPERVLLRRVGTKKTSGNVFSLLSPLLAARGMYQRSGRVGGLRRWWELRAVLF